MAKDITIKFACLDCRKVFKKHKYKEDKHGEWSDIKYEVVCSDCGREMYEAGDAFKPPKASNVREWEKLIPLFETGYKFNRDMGSPFDQPKQLKTRSVEIPKSEFRKPARKRAKTPNKASKKPDGGAAA